MLITPYTMIPFLWVYWIYVAPCHWVFACGSNLKATSIDYCFLCKSKQEKMIKRYGVHADVVQVMKLEALQKRTIKSLKAKSEKIKKRKKEKFERDEARKKLKQGKYYVPPEKIPNFEDDFENKMVALQLEHSNQRRIQLKRLSSLSAASGFKRASPVVSGMFPRSKSITQRHREAAEEMRRKRGDVITTFDTFCMSMIMVFYLLTPTRSL